MARGHYWEMTYDPSGSAPTQNVHLDNLDGLTGYRDRKVTTPSGGPPLTLKTRRSDPVYRFQTCDFDVSIGNALVSIGEFISCRSDGCKWENVKFSNCRFEACHFQRCVFEGCHCVDSCTFADNSASAELFKFNDTAISASAFLG